jgi:tetratricopeptide (TPR) repeat protein
MRLAEACEKAGRPEDARDGLEAVYHDAPTNEQVRARLRALYEQIEAHKELSNLLLVEAKHVTDEAQRFEMLREAGRLRLTSVGAPASAIGPLSEALELRPNDPEITLLLADAYIAAGLVDEAAQMLQTAISRHGGKRSREVAMLQHRMARAAATGDRENQLAWMYTAFDSNPQSGEIASELADLASDLGHFDIALKALRALTSMKSPSPITRPMAYLRQARIAHQQGDDRKAAFLAKKAQSEDPEFAEAREFLQQIGQG